MRQLGRPGSVLVLAVVAACLACGEEDRPAGGAGGSGGFLAPAGSGGGGGSGGNGEGGGGGGGAGGSGGTGSGSPCGVNSLEPGDPITLTVTGAVPFSGQMSQVVGLGGCRVGVQSENRDGVVSYTDATSKYKLDLSWKLAVHAGWDGKTNDDLVGQTLASATKGPETSPLVWFDHTTGKSKFYGRGGSLTIEELDSTHIKGCLHSFTKWETSDTTRTVQVEEPIRFNCKMQ